MDCNAFICCGDFNTSFERLNDQTECLNSLITRNNFCISWNHPVSIKKILHTYTNLLLNQFSCIDHIITTINVFDSIVENVLICDTLNMSNQNIVYMSIEIKNFTNIVNVETCDIHVINCAWKNETTEHKRQYELQLDNNLKQLIDFKNNNLYCTYVLCDSA